MKTLRFAAKQTVPILFSYVFVGIAFGILMIEEGFSLFSVILSSTFIYAGSMQFVMISFVLSGAPLITVAILTFFINARHIFYGIGMLDRFKGMGIKYPYMVLTVTDETYSVYQSISYPKDLDPQQVDFYIAFLCHMLWIVSCVFGAVAGQIMPWDMTGIEFSATLFFVTVVVNQWIDFKSHIPAIVGFISGIAFYFILGKDNFLLPGLSVSMIVLMLLKDKVTLKLEGKKNV